MCLAVIGKVVEVEEKVGIVDIYGIKRKVKLDLVEEVKVGDWVIVHTGFAIQKIGEKEAFETLELLKEFLEGSP